MDKIHGKSHFQSAWWTWKVPGVRRTLDLEFSYGTERARTPEIFHMTIFSVFLFAIEEIFKLMTVFFRIYPWIYDIGAQFLFSIRSGHESGNLVCRDVPKSVCIYFMMSETL